MKPPETTNPYAIGDRVMLRPGRLPRFRKGRTGTVVGVGRSANGDPWVLLRRDDLLGSTCRIAVDPDDLSDTRGTRP